MTPEDLASQGNLELALDALDELEASRAITSDQRLDRQMAVRQARPPVAVYMPLVGRRGEDSLLSHVRVVEGLGAPAPWGDAAARWAADRAIADAWQDVGGAGAPPDLTVELGIGTGTPIEGSSTYLPIYLAAVAALGDQVLTASVLASGSFEHPLDELGEKLSLAERASEHLDVPALLYATNGVELSGPRLERMSDRHHARRRVFHMDPWHASVRPPRIHVFCAGRGAPPGHPGDVRRVELPSQLDAAHLPAAVAEVQAHLQSLERAELSVGGTVWLAAALGVATRNAGATTVRFVDRDGDVVWDNRALSRPIPRDDVAPEARVVVGPADLTVPPDWAHHVVPKHISRADMPTVVHGFLERYGAVPRLHLAFGSALHVAWAIAGMLKNRRWVRYYGWSGEGYVPMFDAVPGVGDISLVAPRAAASNLFLNVSNHPSARWDAPQRRAAEDLAGGPVDDLPFPAVSPSATTEEVLHAAERLTAEIRKISPSAVFLAGEYGVFFAARTLLLEAGVRVVTATTDRVREEDGRTVKSSEFVFVAWRDLRLPRDRSAVGGSSTFL